MRIGRGAGWANLRWAGPDTCRELRERGLLHTVTAVHAECVTVDALGVRTERGVGVIETVP